MSSRTATAAGPFGPPFPIVCVDGRFVDAADASVSVHANVLSYGTGTFEGIRAFWNNEHGQLYLSEAVGHYQRLHRSARMLGLPLPFSVSDLVALTCELLRLNEARVDAYIRPLVVQSGDVLPVRMHDIQTRLSLAATPIVGDYINPNGVRAMVSTWRRQPDTTLPVRAKVIGSYVGPSLAKTEAHLCGYDEAILLTLDGYVAEATTSNILLRVGDQWHTPACTDDILEGITRHQIMEVLLEETGRSVRERRIHRSELYTADEILLCGTAATVAPVVEVDGRRVSNGQAGTQTLALRETLRAIARRDDKRYPEWAVAVYDKGAAGR